MEVYEDDVDTHYCNKCHETINGLDNYVRHRQSGCRTTTGDKSVYHSPPAADVSYPEILNADAFFSSLQLQSSSKTQSPRPSDLLGARPRRSGRHAARKKYQLQNDKEKLPNLLPVDELDDLSIPPLVGFPELVPAASTSKTITTAPSTVTISKHTSIETGGSKIEGETKRERKSSHQEENSDWLVGETIYNEDMQHLNRFEYDYEQDDVTEDSSEEDMVGEDSYSDDEDNQDHLDYPPTSHTGGKWQPGGIIAHEDVQMHEDEPDTEDQHPPPNYTGGKWKPPDTSAVQKSFDNESSQSRKEFEIHQPPPCHTRGKWIPGARADIDTGYWCNPCGRKLASRIVYSRHLLSDLHARRCSRWEIDGLLPSNKPMAKRMKVPALTQRQRALALKKSRVASSPLSKAKKQDQKPRVRNRQKEILTCKVCDTRVRRTQMGKHLRSHYHCRIANSIASTTTTTATTTKIRSNSYHEDENQQQKQLQLEHQRFTLDNIDKIVRQCPFQCNPCRFYCNSESIFLWHWRSEEHKHNVSKIAGSFICPLCDFWCDDNQSMEEHLTKQGHQDAISMINGSVPMVIRRQSMRTCSTCSKRFRYNIELRVHCRDTGHKVAESASDDYQCFMKCDLCQHIARSQLALQRHQLTQHKTEIPNSDLNPYFCSFCSLNFKTIEEATSHRRTSGHKDQVKSSKKSSRHVPRQRICLHCKEVQASLDELKKHMFEKHQNLCYTCGKCGEKFGIPQDVAVHTRDNLCSGSSKKSTPNEMQANVHKCEMCSFTTQSQSEIIYHNILHGDPIVIKTENETRGRLKYSCSVCCKIFSKFNLREHLRVHTGERPYSCFKCKATFVRRVDINTHYLKCLKRNDQQPVKKNRVRKYECDVCADRFFTKYVLRQHILRHAGKEYKCGLPGCPTILRTENELNKHRDVVHNNSQNIRSFKCNQCSYAAKTKIQISRHCKTHEKKKEDDPSFCKCSHEGCTFKTTNNSHMRRHFRGHIGTKPYKCLHCSYASSNVENLRKHVLSTNIHPGKTIYECNFCMDNERFKSNYSKELRAHLLESHTNEFATPAEVRKYVDNIFK